MSEQLQFPAKIVKEGTIVHSARDLVIEIRLNSATVSAFTAGMAKAIAAMGQQPARPMYPFESREADIDI